MTPAATLKISPETATTEARRSVSVTSTRAESNTRPPLMVPRDELFFWTRAWQEGERESAEERRRGNVRTFSTGEDLISWLRSDDD